MYGAPKGLLPSNQLGRAGKLHKSCSLVECRPLITAANDQRTGSVSQHRYSHWQHVWLGGCPTGLEMKVGRLIVTFRRKGLHELALRFGQFDKKR